MKPQKHHRPIQGHLWCSACNGKGKVAHIRGMRAIEIDCPICKGTGKPTFKGKQPIVKPVK